MPDRDVSAPSRTAKDQRANIRMTSRQDQVLRRAAAATDRNLTDFIVDSAVEQAERVLADRRWFIATPSQWEDFNRLLDAPMSSTTRFEKLAARRSPFEDERTP